MSKRLKATSGTAAIVDPDYVAFSISNKLTEGGRRPTVSVEGLAGAETLSFYILVGEAWNPLTNSDGDQIVFTATKTADTFNVADVYGYLKSATADEINLYVTDAR